MEDFELLTKIGEQLVEEHLSVKEENIRLKEIINNDYIISFVIDKKGHFLLPNKKSLQLMGVHAKQLKTKDAYEFFGPTSRASNNIRRALKGESFSDVLKLGKRYWKCTYQPMYDSKKNILGITGISIDVTDIIENPENFKLID